MNLAYINSNEFSFFSSAQGQFNQLINQLQSEDYEDSEQGDIEKFINKSGQEILRCLLQGWLDLKSANEERKTDIKNTEGKVLNHVRGGTARKLTRFFGGVIEGACRHHYQ